MEHEASPATAASPAHGSNMTVATNHGANSSSYNSYSPAGHPPQRRYHGTHDEGTSHKYSSPRHANGHYSKGKGSGYYGNNHNHMGHHYQQQPMHPGRYYNPHLQPPLPPLPPGGSVPPPSPSPSTTSTETTAASPQPSHMENLKCNRCGEPGHFAASCPKKTRHHNGYGKPRMCKFWASGHCQRGDECLFFHGNLEQAMAYGVPNGMMMPGPMPMPMPPYMVDPVNGAYYYPPVPAMPVGYPPYEQPSPTKTPPATGAEGDIYEPGYGPEGAGYGETPYGGAAVYHSYPPPQYPPYAPPQGYPGQRGHYYQQPPPKMYAPQSTYYPYYPRGYVPPPAVCPPAPFEEPVPEATPDATPDATSGATPDTAPVDATPVAEVALVFTVDSPSERTAANKLVATEAVAVDVPPVTKALDNLKLESAAPPKSKKKKKTKAPPRVDVDAATDASPTASPLADKGLRNDTGENNCFLNVVVQNLYHLEKFRAAFRQIRSHDCRGEGRCVLCALATVFGMLAPGDNQEVAASSDALRTVLSTLSTSSTGVSLPPPGEGHNRFSLGSMDDAAEAHDAVLWQLHEALKTAPTTTECTCAIHSVFGLLVGEEATCMRCHSKMAAPLYDTMVLAASTAQLQDHILKKKARSFDKLLAHVLVVGGGTRKCTNAKCRNTDLLPSSLKLKAIPSVLTLGLSWPNAQPSSGYLKNIIGCIEPKIDLTRVFPNLVADGLALPHGGANGAHLMGMFCYFGHHYTTFLFKPATGEWLSFDDTVVKRVGTAWADVQKVCVENHFQPMVLFYDVEMTKPAADKVLQFTIGDFVLSVASEVDLENWRAADADASSPRPQDVRSSSPVLRHK
ncbi:inactive ubiquitin carboxyl-terminal hydrolase 53-like isoform X2 [Achlya hypogyna]|uniref:Inactive ubiquitin carboxyl-terminal hydrolase 53-like isoform X2 n=1 Tax=Achlya hypogyna TaxID=1202772 RepID=A0A1V9YY37_ACHHY|nr:inactive ubiquitin carboxyl-terminal hydrolase 53-like isoform X2 [Achlya hypogyna]